MLEGIRFVLPTPQGGAAELTQEQYRCLTEDGGLSTRQRSAITTAAQILDQVDGDEPLSFPKILERIHGDAGAKPSSIDWNALDALLKAGLVNKLGGGSTTRYAAHT